MRREASHLAPRLRPSGDVPMTSRVASFAQPRAMAMNADVLRSRAAFGDTDSEERARSL